MENNKKFEAKAPDFKGNGIDVWKDKDKNGNLILKIKVLGGKTVVCFKYEPKPKKEIEDL